MFKRFLPVLVSSTMWLASTAFAADTSNPSIVLLTENFPPYNMAKNGKNFAQNDNIEGIAVDILRETFKRADISYSMTLRFPWERIYHLALENPGYGVFVTARVPEREKLFKWVGPIGPDDWVLLARGDSPITLTSLEQARQYRVGAYKGDAIALSLEKQGLAPVIVLRDQDNARKLQAGQIDLWATGAPAGQFLARQVGISGFKTVLRFHQAELYLALNKDVPDELVSKLQKALDQLRAEGVLQKISAKYL
ncbi:MULTISPECIES: substrate-binding periplasmic protein [Pseudomonas]|jgi:polar amino acid transport system substrate-binding protein|uniref:ABC transporter substrate-binding protein n=3 Tax=Pseudomonas TaxID=286 RepID=A0A9Q6VMR2_PSEFR|nr:MULTISPECIES: ABC transporter substrate-binding protein [Pseudomonas]AOA07285.1 amino acid ABC transporter substrate-binding protein [Pseudomonas sp. TMW 2.1634]ARQ76676.1 amino acid ABC transporter substrate-binding protein [Pseudomonas fragi]ASC87045.1 amino acid ABC transporter substrate-binding protein [Pseudomonas fragi]MBM1205370.1 ABC transporter substrate-binding protein [Pseudomonas fragi]MDE4512289.1 ABC transporter substrate-binding protein [Pseudomonas fragi]